MPLISILSFKKREGQEPPHAAQSPPRASAACSSILCSRIQKVYPNLWLITPRNLPLALARILYVFGGSTKSCRRFCRTSSTLFKHVVSLFFFEYSLGLFTDPKRAIRKRRSRAPRCRCNRPESGFPSTPKPRRETSSSSSSLSFAFFCSWDGQTNDHTIQCVYICCVV